MESTTESTGKQRKADKTESTPKEKKPTNMVLVILVVILILQVLMSGYQIVSGVIHDVQRQKLLTNVETYTATVDKLTTQMLTDYKTEVYNNTNVDTTAKQQVMGIEYNFNAMLLLVKQNNRLMEILAQMR